MTAGKPFREWSWGGANAARSGVRRFGWVDLVMLLSVCGLLYGLADLARQWSGQHRVSVTIDLSPWALPRYTFYSLSRGVLAYVLSLTFTLLYGYWAAKDHIAERILVPLLDILQSTPVLTFLPPLLLAAESLFPGSNIGFELASIVMVFTGQAWNMTFSFYHSLRSLPQDMIEVATLYRFTTWQRFKWLELPYSMMGLVWNSMMSFAGGWFFLTISEAFKTGDQDFRIPGIGSYMSEAVKNKEYGSMIWALLAMTVMIVALDQLLWRPVVVWAQRFRVEEGGEAEAMSSWFLNFLRRSQLLAALGRALNRVFQKEGGWTKKSPVAQTTPQSHSPWPARLSRAAFAVLLAILCFGAWRLLQLLQKVSVGEWEHICLGAGVTLSRVLMSLLIGTLWTVPAGLAIGLSPRLSRVLQPVVQVVASFPAPLFFPLLVVGMNALGLKLGIGSILLMLLGTQWYILFNVIAGTMAIPADLREAARSYRMTTWQRFKVLYLPAIFPYLVTGWVTAAGGAWNTSIVAEYVTYGTEPLTTFGLGSLITEATEKQNLPLLMASALVMAVLVVVFNRLVWKRLYLLAEERYSLTK